MSFYSRVKLNLYGKNVLKYLESKFKSLVFKLFIIIIIIIIITIVISMFCFRFDNGYTLYDVWNCRAAVALTSYYGRASLARRKQRRLQTSICLMKTQPFESNTSSEGSRETRKCPQSSLRLLLILTRAKHGEGKCGGWWEGGKRLPFPFHLPIVPFSPVP